ncbi:UNKNOWN [Stylonychia lemnae]|uniref:Uncharacterized protein n=1 Tax=Stylonychia lemnae TaxID=5949 RepID=A0A077ZW29_STYLE|nr:UNKNOWN [Stylonychia lemnae]|eukprot:CDW73470.1 UNKNOWN [Stylonychia lemnae]
MNDAMLLGESEFLSLADQLRAQIRALNNELYCDETTQDAYATVQVVYPQVNGDCKPDLDFQENYGWGLSRPKEDKLVGRKPLKLRLCQPQYSGQLSQKTSNPSQDLSACDWVEHEAITDQNLIQLQRNVAIAKYRLKTTTKTFKPMGRIDEQKFLELTPMHVDQSLQVSDNRGDEMLTQSQNANQTQLKSSEVTTSSETVLPNDQLMQDLVSFQIQAMAEQQSTNQLLKQTEQWSPAYGKSHVTHFQVIQESPEGIDRWLSLQAVRDGIYSKDPRLLQTMCYSKLFSSRVNRIRTWQEERLQINLKTFVKEGILSNGGKNNQSPQRNFTWVSTLTPLYHYYSHKTLEQAGISSSGGKTQLEAHKGSKGRPSQFMDILLEEAQFPLYDSKFPKDDLSPQEEDDLSPKDNLGLWKEDDLSPQKSPYLSLLTNYYNFPQVQRKEAGNSPHGQIPYCGNHGQFTRHSLITQCRGIEVINPQSKEILQTRPIYCAVKDVQNQQYSEETSNVSLVVQAMLHLLLYIVLTTLSCCCIRVHLQKALQLLLWSSLTKNQGDLSIFPTVLRKYNKQEDTQSCINTVEVAATSLILMIASMHLQEISNNPLRRVVPRLEGLQIRVIRSDDSVTGNRMVTIKIFGHKYSRLTSQQNSSRDQDLYFGVIQISAALTSLALQELWTIQNTIPSHNSAHGEATQSPSSKSFLVCKTKSIPYWDSQHRPIVLQYR